MYYFNIANFKIKFNCVFNFNLDISNANAANISKGFCTSCKKRSVNKLVFFSISKKPKSYLTLMSSCTTVSFYFNHRILKITNLINFIFFSLTYWTDMSFF